MLVILPEKVTVLVVEVETVGIASIGIVAAIGVTAFESELGVLVPSAFTA